MAENIELQEVDYDEKQQLLKTPEVTITQPGYEQPETQILAPQIRAKVEKVAQDVKNLQSQLHALADQDDSLGKGSWKEFQAEKESKRTLEITLKESIAQHIENLELQLHALAEDIPKKEEEKRTLEKELKELDDSLGKGSLSWKKIQDKEEEKRTLEIRLKESHVQYVKAIRSYLDIIPKELRLKEEDIRTLQTETTMHIECLREKRDALIEETKTLEERKKSLDKDLIESHLQASKIITLQLNVQVQDIKEKEEEKGKLDTKFRELRDCGASRSQSYENRQQMRSLADEFHVLFEEIPKKEEEKRTLEKELKEMHVEHAIRAQWDLLAEEIHEKEKDKRTLEKKLQDTEEYIDEDGEYDIQIRKRIWKLRCRTTDLTEEIQETKERKKTYEEEFKQMLGQCIETLSSQLHALPKEIQQKEKEKKKMEQETERKVVWRTEHIKIVELQLHILAEEICEKEVEKWTLEEELQMMKILVDPEVAEVVHDVVEYVEDEYTEDGNRKSDKRKAKKEDGNRKSDKRKAKKANEEELNSALDDGNIGDITALVTPYGLGNCSVNCLEKSMEVSSRLHQLGQVKSPDAEDLIKLGTSVEDFAVELIEPLKGDDMRRAYFGGEDFNRISDKAVQFEQKKFVSHPVVYNLLMRRWEGDFWRIRYSPFVSWNWWMWILLNIWTVFDLVFFPAVFAVFFFIHKIISFVKRRKEHHVVFLLKASGIYKETTFGVMQSITKKIMNEFNPICTNVNYAVVLHTGEEPIFCINKETIARILNMKNIPKIIKQQGFQSHIVPALTKAAYIFSDRYSNNGNKALVVLADDKCGAKRVELKEAKESLQKSHVKIIPVSVGFQTAIKELEAMTTLYKDIALLTAQADYEKVSKGVRDSIFGDDIFDLYLQYFTTPYFIFVRDTLSYLVLLGLHFAMCLQPSTRHFTATEWVILFFFLGRLMMEIYQVVMGCRSPEEKEDTGDIGDIGDTGNIGDMGKRWTGNKKRVEREKRKTKLKQKLWTMIKQYFSDNWNRLDAATLAFYLILLVLRAITWSSHAPVSQNRLLAVAGYLYGLNALLLTLRVFGHIMESTEGAGAIQIALFHIIGAVVVIFGQFMVALMAFSLAATKIYVVEMSYSSASNTTSHGWWSATQHLGWSLLGIADLGPLQSSDSLSDALAMILYGVFLILGVVMLMNMMIALLSNTYQQVEDNSFHEWSYKKAITIRTYSRYHPVPVPFNVISLTAELLYFVYTSIRHCSTCDKNTHQELPIDCVERSPDSKIFDTLVDGLQAVYFSKYGNSFPLTGESKMDDLMKETYGNRQIVGHIAKRVFMDDREERAQGYPKGDSAWNFWGMRIDGDQLSYLGPDHCIKCLEGNANKRHGARYNKPVSSEFPGFEVLIKECGKRQLIAIGLVSEDYDLHLFPGWRDNTVGYHIDTGRIFGKDNAKSGRIGDDAMAHRGDMIGCFVRSDAEGTLDEDESNGNGECVTVSFTLNDREVGTARVDGNAYSSGNMYPYVALGSENTSVLVKMRPVCVTQPVTQVTSELQDVSSRLDDLNRNFESLLKIVHGQEKLLKIVYDNATEVTSLRTDLAPLVEMIRSGAVSIQNNLESEEQE